MKSTNLDYDKAQIVMVADSRLEREVRLHSASKEPETISFIERMPASSIFYDIGACCGSYSLVAAARGLEVVAFEPAWFNYQRLCENIRLNMFERQINPMPIALGRVTHMSHMAFSSVEPGAALHTIKADASALAIPVFSLDELVGALRLPRPEFAKIDVDGYEPDVLAGGPFTLRHARSILVESCDETALAIEDWMRAGRYHTVERYPHEHSGVTNEIWSR